MERGITVANERMRKGGGGRRRSDLRKNAVGEQWGEKKKKRLGSRLTEWMLRGRGGRGMEKERGKGGT